MHSFDHCVYGPCCLAHGPADQPPNMLLPYHMYMETVQASKHGPHIIYDYKLMRTLAKSLVQHSAWCSNIWPVTMCTGIAVYFSYFKYYNSI